MPVFRTLILALSAAALTAAAHAAASPEGRWLTEKKHGIVEVYRCGADGTLCGRLVWFQIEPGDPNKEGLDIHNPDPARRNRSLCGVVFMTGFKPAEANAWEDGTLYDPETGKTYSGTLAMQPDGMLRLRGYIGTPLLGRNTIWSRHPGPVPPCPSK
jgi:uncharacterized protein (DUF2147 family)